MAGAGGIGGIGNMTDTSAQIGIAVAAQAMQTLKNTGEEIVEQLDETADMQQDFADATGPFADRRPPSLDPNVGRNLDVTG